MGAPGTANTTVSACLFEDSLPSPRRCAYLEAVWRCENTQTEENSENTLQEIHSGHNVDALSEGEASAAVLR